jgi:hypothetical protein
MWGVKVLILTASLGEGHLAAARGVEAALGRLGGEGVRVEVLDVLEAVYGRLNRLASAVCRGLNRRMPVLRRAMRRLMAAAPAVSAAASLGGLRWVLGDILAEADPDVVVSTHPFYAEVIERLFRDHAERPFRLYTVVTDLLAVDRAWHRSPSDLFLVPDERVAEGMVAAGVERARVAVTGLPVRPAGVGVAAPDVAGAGAALRIAEWLLGEEAMVSPEGSMATGGGGEVGVGFPAVMASPRRGPLLCDFHIHTRFSDGQLGVGEVVDFYGAHGFDCICITDHLADPRRWIGKVSRLSRLVMGPGQLEAYFEAVRREVERAWRRYRMLVMTGIEFNKDGFRARTSAHLLGIGLTEPIAADRDIPETVARIQAQGGLAVASHPHVMRSEWGKNTLHFWDNLDLYEPMLDAWEIANRENLFSPVALKRLPFLANSDFHKPRHIYSWKSLLDCEKDPGAIRECVRRNERVSITLYRRGGRAFLPAGPSPAGAHEQVGRRAVEGVAGVAAAA